VRFAVGGIVATVYLVVALLLLVGATQVDGFALCSDPEAVNRSGEDDCIEGSSGERLIGLVLAYGAVATAFATVALGVWFASRHERGPLLALTAVATPLLTVGALALLPISF
jgi:hypothetical protein